MYDRNNIIGTLLFTCIIKSLIYFEQHFLFLFHFSSLKVFINLSLNNLYDFDYSYVLKCEK
jgi:hypothetical protein